MCICVRKREGEREGGKEGRFGEAVKEEKEIKGRKAIEDLQGNRSLGSYISNEESVF